VILWNELHSTTFQLEAQMLRELRQSGLWGTFEIDLNGGETNDCSVLGQGRMLEVRNTCDLVSEMEAGTCLVRSY
jgi:hypothetical protein